MSLWSVSNGYRGNGWVHVLVEAATAEEAIAQAVPILKRQGEKFSTEANYWSGPDIRAEKIQLPFLTELG